MSLSIATSPSSSALACESSVRDYWVLLKPGVLSLVVFSALTGMVLAPGTIHPFLGAITLLSIALGSGGGAALNMWFDRDIDAIMLRTARRPVPAGRIHPDNAFAFGIILSATAVMLLGLSSDWFAAFLLAFAIFFYAVVYTMWLKRRTAQNIVIGGAAGAFPPVIGWLAVTGEMHLYPWLLFLIIFLWTPPHFWALALYRGSDYARANIPMLPVTSGAESTRRHILLYSYLLVISSMLPVFLHYAGILYALTAILLNSGFLWRAHRLQHYRTDTCARALFGYSILYLFALLSMLMLDQWSDGVLRTTLLSPA